MDDSEARYLIEQFNKYVSWKTRHGELELVALAVAVATAGLAVSVGGWVLRSVPPTIVTIVLPAVLLLLVLVIVLDGLRQHRRIERTYEDCEKRLMALEDYRSKHKALPDGITFRLIVEKPEEVRRILGNSS